MVLTGLGKSDRPQHFICLLELLRKKYLIIVLIQRLIDLNSRHFSLLGFLRFHNFKIIHFFVESEMPHSLPPL
jgi:hypothetical protein